jgi:arylsulfatase A-like enzyme
MIRSRNRQCSYWWFAALLVGGLAWLASTSALAADDSQRPARKPNIVLIMADDLGYGDLSCYGQKSFSTPNIDRLAKEGMRFTDYYAGSTVCAPSRCVLMTGYHTGHCVIRGNARLPLRPEDVTLAEVLKQAGYRTGLFGKWGLGEEESTGYPTRQGFDEFYGYVNQRHAHNYYPTFLLDGEKRVKLENVVPDEGPDGVGKASEKRQYSHDLIVERALDFITRQKDEPFFLYLALTIPHANNEAKLEGMEVPDLGEFASKDWPQGRKGHAAMITHMDRDIGRLRAKLESLGIAKDTLILFTSDNGPHNEAGYQHEMNDSNGPLRGCKRDLYDGGIRVPLVAWWPEHIAAGSTTDQIGAHQDMMPTLAAIAGATKFVPADIDGISLAPTLLGQPDKQQQHEYLYWVFYERGGSQGVRSGPWKLVEQPYGTPPQLYDVTKDIGEQNDLAAQHPDVVAKLTAYMKQAYTPSEDWTIKKPRQGLGQGQRRQQ